MARISPPQVLCCGEALLDRLLPVAAGPSLTDHGEEPCVDRLGGAPANVACALARLGTHVAFLGRVGRDATGRAFAALLAERGVEASALQWDPQRASRIVLVRRDASGERSFGGFQGDRGDGFADQALDASGVRSTVPPLLPGLRWLVCGSLALASPASAAAQEALLALAPAGVRLAVDLNWRPTFWGLPPAADPPAAIRERIRPLLERAQLLTCSAEEARSVLGSDDPALIGARLPGRPVVCVSDGPRTLRWWWGGRGGSLEPFAIPVADSTGAGDAFLAGLLHALLRSGQPLERQPDPLPLLRFAAACGALVCQGEGAIAPQPDAAAVERFLSERAQ